MNRCLVIDDSSVIRKVARHILEGVHFNVSEAENGEEALLQCSKLPTPDVILLDWHLPVLGAIEFLNRLRSTAAGRRPYVIYCTTENDPDDIARAHAAGANDYLLKPFSRDDVLTKLTEIKSAA